MHYGFWYRFLGIILAFLHISKISKSGKSIGNCTYRYQFGSRHCFLQQWDMHDLRQKSKRGFALVALRNTILQGDGCKWQALWVLPQRSQAAWFSWQSCYREGREKGVVCTWKCGDRAVELYIWCICSGFQCEMYWIPSGLVGWSFDKFATWSAWDGIWHDSTQGSNKAHIFRPKRFCIENQSKEKNSCSVRE